QGSNVIRVDVVSLHSSQGDVKCALFNSAVGFPDDSSRAVKLTSAKIEGNKASCSFADGAPGGYAVSVYHDEKSNGKLDRNFIGVQREGVGASNDAKGSMGPPHFDDAKFTYAGGARALTINIQSLTGLL